MKKKTFEATAYDEASSGSDSSSSSSSDSDSDDDDSSSAASIGHSSSSVNHKVAGLPSLRKNDKGADSDHDSGDDSQEDDVNNDSSSVEEPVHRRDDDEKSTHSSGDDEEADLPLQERIGRKEGRGHSSLKEKRERQRNALQVANERLAKVKKSKTEGKSLSAKKEDSKSNGATVPIKKKKKSKHAPTEASSKRSEFYRRGAPRLNESGVGIEIGAHRYEPMDPRTSSLSGRLNEEQFEQNYEFLQDMRNKEISQLKKKITARKETGKKGKRMRRKLNVSVADGTLEHDEDRLRQLKQEKADFERRKIVRAAKQSVKRKIRTEVEEGKRGAFFLKRKEKKRLEFEAKMEELRKRGGHKAVEKALEKRRQKAKSRDAGLFAK